MHNPFNSILKKCLIVVATLGLAATAYAADNAAVGKWTWSFTPPNGQEMTQSLIIKQDGDKLTGAITGRNRETPVEDLQVKGDDLSFKVVRERSGTKTETKYSGKISGDEIKGKIESNMGGQNRSRDWTAKREKK
jgi:hypothetical protein